MTLVAETILAVLDVFQKKEGVWSSTLPLSYLDLTSAISSARVTFAEWDPQRGLYFLDFSPLDSPLATMDLLLLDFK